MAGSDPGQRQHIGRYEVLRWLGSGNFAAVYLAFDPALDVRVAVKVLGDHHTSNFDVRERFIQEARMLRKLANDRLVTVRDVGEVDGQPYFVMDAFEHGTLADRIASLDSPPTPALLRHLVSEIEQCLSAVHDGGLVHRDVKPSNLLIRTSDAGTSPGALLAEDEQLVLGDFGIARDAEATGLTLGAGTHGYMAPEQAAPLTTIDHRVDIYAATAVMAQVLDIVWAAHERPPELAAALDRGLGSDPQQRPSSAAEWGAAMRAALESERAGASAAPAVSSGGWLRKSAAALLVVAVALGGFFAARTGADTPSIVGPDEVQLGTDAIFTYEARDDATYLWTDSAGREHLSRVLRITPRTEGSLSLTLEETIGGTTRSMTKRVQVIGP